MTSTLIVDTNRGICALSTQLFFTTKRHAFKHLIKLLSDSGISFCSLTENVCFNPYPLWLSTLTSTMILYFLFTVHISIRELIIPEAFVFHKHIFFMFKNRILQQLFKTFFKVLTCSLNLLSRFINFNHGYKFWAVKDRNFKHGIGTPLVKYFQCMTLACDLDLDRGH